MGSRTIRYFVNDDLPVLAVLKKTTVTEPTGLRRKTWLVVLPGGEKKWVRYCDLVRVSILKNENGNGSEMLADES
jgi:hypothetical protein